MEDKIDAPLCGVKYGVNLQVNCASNNAYVLFRNLLKIGSKSNNNVNGNKNISKAENTEATSEKKDLSDFWSFAFKKAVNIGSKNGTSQPKSLENTTESARAASDNGALLPGIDAEWFLTPKYIPANEWVRSQLFDVIFNCSNLSQLIMHTDSADFSQSWSNRLDKAAEQLENYDSLIPPMVAGFEFILSIYAQHSKLFIDELKMELHINTLLMHLVELGRLLEEDDAAKLHEALSIDTSIGANSAAMEQILSRCFARSASISQ